VRLLPRRSALPQLDEAAAYARCHGGRDNDVRIVKLPPRRPRYEDVLTTGEELRVLFEERLDARETESAQEQAKAGPGNPLPAPPDTPAAPAD
jgi:hypothetical protein